MYCPRCGSTQSDELRFCKACGANLLAVRQVLDPAESSEKFDWSKTWVAEMFMSSEEVKRRQLEMQRQRGITPAVRRYQEIKAGVITSSVGVAIAIFLSVFMEGIIRSGKVSFAAAEILSHLWVAGVIPMLVGVSLIVNGWFVSRKIVELSKEESQLEPHPNPPPQALRSGETNEFASSEFSVTEGTTKHLGGGRA
jgi:hypothetical protein